MTTLLRFRPEDVPIDGRDVDVELPPSWVAGLLGVPEGAEPTPTRVTGRLEAAGTKIVFRGRLRTTFTFECSRCVAVSSLPVDADFAHVFAPRSEHPEDDVDDDGMTFIDGHSFDAEPVVAEELALAVPDFPVCSEDCKGLCTQCGADLNVEPCDCKPPVDPRLAALQKIKI